MTKFLRSLIFIGIVLTFGAAANAQLSTQYVAEIPFDFQVKDRAFKAGTYRLEPVGSDSNVAAVALHSRADNSRYVIGMAQLSSDNGGAGKLIFLKQNGQHMLQRIATPTIAMKFKTTPSSKLAQASPGPKPEIVAIALK
jgi:hypothetical protein